VDKRNLASARMKAQARLARYKDKRGGDEDEESFKKAFIQRIMQDPVLMEYAMKNDPEAMSRMMRKYGLQKE